MKNCEWYSVEKGCRCRLAQGHDGYCEFGAIPLSTPLTDGDAVSMNGEKVDRDWPDPIDDPEQSKSIGLLLHGFHRAILVNERNQNVGHDRYCDAVQRYDEAIKARVTATVEEAVQKERDERHEVEAGHSQLATLFGVLRMERDGLADIAESVSAVLVDVAQLLDGWHQDGTAWSSWDESVRQRVSSVLKQIADSRPSPSRPAGGDTHG